MAFLCAFTLHAIAYERLGAIGAIKRSVQLVRTNFLNVLVLMLLISLAQTIGGSDKLENKVAAFIPPHKTDNAWGAMGEGVAVAGALGGRQPGEVRCGHAPGAAGAQAARPGGRRGNCHR